MPQRDMVSQELVCSLYSFLYLTFISLFYILIDLYFICLLILFIFTVGVISDDFTDLMTCKCKCKYQQL